MSMHGSTANMHQTLRQAECNVCPFALSAMQVKTGPMRCSDHNQLCVVPLHGKHAVICNQSLLCCKQTHKETHSSCMPHNMYLCVTLWLYSNQA